ncbi:phosphoribosylanthranilate isomerase [Micractinium conductrix]|uniref:phosphoribosylanthranilate isomerase n=1 Tax=Micractinium conductrix TaxID=554055 RepID=A0A2P6VLL0_9CHLO|nr:phosphoribosylanthranilate isomerase [Micractinium conductrix]|eukprot:PSC74964.1 phosphoribosylanthranilate isomerase [Micractinium conductrix]
MIILTLPPCASVRPHARRPPAVCRPLARQQQFQMVHTTGRQAPNRYRCTAAAAGATAAAAAAAGADPPLVAPALALQPGQPVVKVCGVINAEDAAAAVAAGANLIGMILWPRAKRSVGGATAAAIAAAARAGGAEPVGVFVDEDAATIARVCAEAGVRVAQLHGEGARAALAQLPPDLAVVWVLHADKTGVVQSPLPPAGCRQPHWLIVDGLQGGSGEAFDWQQLRRQAAGFAASSTHGWLLAGGLTPETVAEAIATATPTGVDVSSGVCGPDGLKKDLGKVQRYCSAAAAAFAAAASGGA